MSDDSDFYKTDAGQFIANAHRYLSAAKLLTEQENWISLHQIPSLHLLAHGIELLLKYPLLRAGMSQTLISKQFGHNVALLWNLPSNKALRSCVCASADIAWKEAEESGLWPDKFSGDVEESLSGGIEKLSILHDRDSKFALRYTMEKPMLAPRPRFLVEAFSDVAERTCANPNYINYWA